MKQHAMPLSILALALSIIIGGYFISQGLDTIAFNQPHNPIHTELTTYDGDEYQKMLTADDLSSYLGITMAELRIISAHADVGNQETIPFIQIGDTVYYSKKAVDNWLENHESVIFKQ